MASSILRSSGGLFAASEEGGVEDAGAWRGGWPRCKRICRVRVRGGIGGRGGTISSAHIVGLKRGRNGGFLMGAVARK